MPLRLEIVSPEQKLFEGDANIVVCRTVAGGDIGFETGHAPFVGTLQIGQVRAALVGGGTLVAAVHRGFVEVSHDRVTVLSDVAELPEQIDVARAEAARDRAAERLRGAPDDPDARAAAARAALRLEVAAAPVAS